MVIVCVVLVLTVVGVVGVLLGAVDVEVLVTDEDLSVVIVGFNLLGSGVFLLGNFSALDSYLKTNFPFMIFDMIETTSNE